MFTYRRLRTQGQYPSELYTEYYLDSFRWMIVPLSSAYILILLFQIRNRFLLQNFGSGQL